MADVTVFDPALVAERGTVAAPNAYAIGIDQVVVNGQLAFTNGAFTDVRAGHVLRRSAGGRA